MNVSVLQTLLTTTNRLIPAYFSISVSIRRQRNDETIALTCNVWLHSRYENGSAECPTITRLTVRMTMISHFSPQSRFKEL